MAEYNSKRQRKLNIGISSYTENELVLDVIGNTNITGITSLASAGGITTTGGDLYVGRDLYVKNNISFNQLALTNLNITGIATVGEVTINSTGIITSTNPGVSTVFYYGDGSNLTGLKVFSVEVQKFIADPVYITFAEKVGVSSIGISSEFAFIPSLGFVGIGTTNPTSKLTVIGDGYFSGILTSGEFIGGGFDLRNLSGTHLVSYASESDISNSSESISGVSNYNQVGILSAGPNSNTYDRFGNSIAFSADGKTIVIGSYFGDIGGSNVGGAYIFDRVGNSFNQVGILSAGSNADSGDWFGQSVAISADGKTIVVGAILDDVGGFNVGNVYVFDRVGNSFNQVGILSAGVNVDFEDYFGQSVAISANGKTIAVGVPYGNINNINTGSVYIFDRVVNTFNQVGILSASSNINSGDWFGQSVSLSADGKTVVVGSPFDDVSGNDEGNVYIFDRVGNSFNQVGVITGFYAIDFEDRFGFSVTTNADGKTIAIGVPFDDIGSTDVGSVYIFDRVGNSFNQVGILSAGLNIDSGDWFGHSIALSADGKTVVVGSIFGNVGGSDVGNAYVFKRIGNKFDQIKILSADSNVGTYDFFGYYVGITADGKTIAVGAIFDDVGGFDIGNVYVFDEVRETYLYSNSLGNIGIGISNPTSKLHVGGDGLFTGIVTATSFVGNLVGIASTATNVIGGIASVTQLNVTGVSTLGVVTAGNIFSTGIITATSFIGNLVGTISTAGSATTAINVIGGIASVTQLSVTGVSTLGVVTAGNIFSTGIITATSFVGNLVGIATTAINVIGGIASVTQLNVTGVSTLGVVTAGNIFSTGIVTATSFVSTSASVTQLNVTGVSTLGVVTAGNIFSTGIVTATSFVGNLVGVASTAINVIGGIASVTQLNVTGIATIGQVAINSTGIITSTNPGVSTVFYYGDGSNLSNIRSESIIGTIKFAEVSGVSTVSLGLSGTPNINVGVITATFINVTNDVQINRNLNVNGNITVGGTAAYIIVNEFIVKDKDIVLGYTTDSYGNDVSNDTTANHGGIAVASSEGSPLVSLYNPGVGETTPATYKKIMWFKSGSFTGLNTDAWLFNYGVGIGSTQIPNGVRLAAGDVHITEFDISKVRNINASGIVTATSFVGNLVGIATTATNVIGGIASVTQLNVTGVSTLGVVTAGNIFSTGIITATSVVSTSASVTQLSVTGVSTLGVVTAGNIFSTGIITATSFVGNLVGIATTATNVIGGIASVTQLSVTGVSTFTNGPVLIGTGTSTGTASQPLQVTGGAYVSGNLGIGTTSPRSNLDVNGNVLITGVTTISSNLIVNGNTLYVDAVNNRVGIGTTLPTSSLHVVGDGLFTGIVTAASFVGNLVGVASTATNVIDGIASVTQLSVTGVSTFTNGPVLIGTGTSTGTASQPLQVTGGAYVSGNLGIGKTTANYALDIATDIGIGRSLYDSNNSRGTNNFVLTSTATGVLWQSVTGTGAISGINVAPDNTNSARFISFLDISSGTTANIYVSPSNLTYNPGLNNFGIGTTNPIQRFQVGSGSSSVVITSSGNLGIGTTNPSTSFEVYGSSNLIGNVGIGSSYPIQISHYNEEPLRGGGYFYQNQPYPIQYFSISPPVSDTFVTSLVATASTIGIGTNIIQGITTTGITVGLELYPISSVIATGTTVSSIGTNQIGIGTTSLNSTQRNNISLNFGSRTGIIDEILTIQKYTGSSPNILSPILRVVAGVGTTTRVDVFERVNLTNTLNIGVGGSIIGDNIPVTVSNNLEVTSNLLKINPGLSTSATGIPTGNIYISSNTVGSLPVTIDADYRQSYFRINSVGFASTTNLTSFSFIPILDVNINGNIGIGTSIAIQRVQIGSRADLVPVYVGTAATIGITTTIINGISTSSIRTGLEIVAVSGIIAAGTTITTIGSNSIGIGTSTLNATQRTNVTLSFAERNDSNVVAITSTGSVGIGTTNPRVKLQVVGATRVTSLGSSDLAQIDLIHTNTGLTTGVPSRGALYFNSDIDGGIPANNGGQLLSIVSDNTNLFTVNRFLGLSTITPAPLGLKNIESVFQITSDGTVGIATTFPDINRGIRFQVVGDTRITSAGSTNLAEINIRHQSSSGLNTSAPSTGALFFDGISQYSTTGIVTGGQLFSVLNDNNSLFTVNRNVGFSTFNPPTTGLRFIETVVDISNSGNIGIGNTTNVPTRVQINSLNEFASSTISYASSIGISTNIISISTTGLSVGLEIQAFTGVIATGTTVISIGSSQIGIGTTTLNSSLRTNTPLTFGTRTNSRVVSITSTGFVGIGTTNPVVRLDVIGNARFTGIVTALDFDSSSDINLKENIRVIENPVDKIKQINGVQFNWKSSGKSSVGLIAQEVEKVLPELVSGSEVKSLNYNGLIGLLVEVVKNQQKEIEILKNQIENINIISNS